MESASSYEQASAEFSMKQLIMSDPIHEAVAKLESKHQKVHTIPICASKVSELGSVSIHFMMVSLRLIVKRDLLSFF